MKEELIEMSYKKIKNKLEKTDKTTLRIIIAIVAEAILFTGSVNVSELLKISREIPYFGILLEKPFLRIYIILLPIYCFYKIRVIHYNKKKLEKNINSLDIMVDRSVESVEINEQEIKIKNKKIENKIKLNMLEKKYEDSNNTEILENYKKELPLRIEEIEKIGSFMDQSERDLNKIFHTKDEVLSVRIKQTDYNFELIISLVLFSIISIDLQIEQMTNLYLFTLLAILVVIFFIIYINYSSKSIYKKFYEILDKNTASYGKRKDLIKSSIEYSNNAKILLEVEITERQKPKKK